MIKNQISKIFFLALFIFLNSTSFAQENNIDSSRFYNVAVIQALNKITAKSSILEIKVGEKVNFGTLQIIAHKCWQASLDQEPESKILLEIFEKKVEDKKDAQRIFYGWIFASSPSVSGLEHPIYDLTAINCKR